MLNYSYEVNDASGETHRGILAAENLAAALAQLEARGFSVRSISVLDGPANPFSDSQSTFRSRLSETLADRKQWLPALQAMANELPQGPPKRETKRLVNYLSRDLDCEQFLKSPDVAAVLPLLTSGNESVGNSSHNTARMQDWLTEVLRAHQAQTRRRKMLIYPSVLVLVTLAILVFFSMFLIPIFRQMFTEFGLSLPAPTLLTFWLAEQVSTYLLRTLLIGAIACLVLFSLIRLWRKHAMTNRLLGKYVAGTSSNLRSMSALTSTLAELLSLDCPVPDALVHAGQASRHWYFQRAASSLADQVAKGMPPEQLESSTDLPPSLVRALWTGREQTPSVPLLRELATIYGERAQSRKEFIAEGLPAIGVIVLGLLIGFVVVSLFMPLVSMVSSLA